MTESTRPRPTVACVYDIKEHMIRGLCHKNVIFVTIEIKTQRQVPLHKMIAFAMIGDGEKKVELSVVYHQGLQKWCLAKRICAEQIDAHLEPMTMPDAIAEFERQVGVTLPLITVCDSVFGVYNAKSHNPVDNPFALVDGRKYRVTMDQLGKRIFQAKLKGEEFYLESMDGLFPTQLDLSALLSFGKFDSVREEA